MTDQSDHSGGGIALSGKEFWREPSLIARDVEADKVTDRLDIFFESIKLFWIFPRYRSAVPSGYRINKDQIGYLNLLLASPSSIS